MKIKLTFFITFFALFLSSCQSVSEKIDEKTLDEEKQLNKWLNKSVEDLQTFYGKPDKIDLLESGNKNYIYISKKYNIKCIRKFEVTPSNFVTGFSSKNCF